jgi:hypothetical protein
MKLMLRAKSQGHGQPLWQPHTFDVLDEVSGSRTAPAAVDTPAKGISAGIRMDPAEY